MSDQPTNLIQRVTVVDMDMSFGTMVLFMVTLVIAAIPAMLILAFLGMVLAAIFGGLGGLATRI